MKIKDAKMAFKIADVKAIDNSTKLNFIYLNNLLDENGKSLPNNILTKNYSRVYIIVVDGIIKKIGASEDKGGIKNTLNIYKDGGIKGRPSIRSFGIWYFLYSNVLQGKKIEFYMIYHENIEMEIKGLLKKHKVKDASISCKLIEKCCISDYKNLENNKFPEWNVQEKREDWPDIIKEKHSKIISKSVDNKKSKRNKMSL